MKKHILTIALGLIICYLLFTNIEDKDLIESLKLEKERTEKELKKKDENIRQLISDFHEQELRAIQVIQDATIRAERAEEKLTIANEKLKSVRFVRFANDSVRSGAISELYPSYVRP